MKTIDEIMQAVTSPAMLDDLTDLVRSHEEAFTQEEVSFQEAVAALKAVLPVAAVDEYISACQTRVISNILYAAYEGYRANLQNFYSPCATSFPKKDFSHYIRDHLIGHFPPAVDAAQRCDAFTKNLSEDCEEAAEAIRDYFYLLDFYGPKLAHFAGYVLANKFLPWVVPGYREDNGQTFSYRTELNRYIGFSICDWENPVPEQV